MTTDLPEPARSPETRVDPAAWRRPRWSVAAYFGLLGVMVGVWVARIPEIQARLGLDDGRLGVALLMSAAGATGAMPLTGRLAARVGTRALAWGSAGGAVALLPLIAWAPSRAALMAVLLAYGATTGIFGVVVNAMAVEVERRIGRPVLSTFHGLFSLGCLVGASIAAACMARGLGPLASLVGAAAGIALAFLLAAPALPAASIGPAGGATAGPARATRRPDLRLLGLGALAFLGLVGEGSMGDWSAVYLHRELGASAALAALGYAAYSLGMTAGRFLGDRLSGRLGDGLLLRGGAALASAGLFATVGVGHPAPAVAGLALVGLGLANAVPVLYRAAARTPGVDPVAGISVTSSVGYLGFLAGPTAIGQVSARSDLGTALALVAVAVGAIALGGLCVGPSTAKGRAGGRRDP